MRVLVTTDVVGGVWDACVVLARELRAASHAVTLLAIGSPNPTQRAAAARAGAELLSAPLKLEWMQDSAADVGATSALVASVARQTGAHVIHANQFAAACVDLDLPVVLTVHSDVLSWRKWTLGDPGVPDEWQAYAQLGRKALARADRVVAVSRFLAEEVRSLYRVERQIDVIYNGWPTARSSAHKSPFALVAGRVWDAAKNVPLVAQAARGWDAGSIYLAGENTHPDGGEAPTPTPLQSLGVLSREDMDSWLDRAAIYISAARYDPFGLLPLQAALRGCALLLSDIPSYREIWDDAATFFRTDNAADLRRQWQALMRTPTSSKAYHRAVNQYSLRNMARAYERSYESAKRGAAV